jgi:HAD superfamily hydrolase (TIGR01458 family)
VKALLLDIAGVLYDGDAPLPGAVAALARLQASGLPFRLVTNTSRRPKRALVAHLRHLGFDVAADHVFTGTQAAVAHVRAQRLSPFLLVHPALDEEFEGLAGGPPRAVVVGDAADRFTYARLNAAFRLLLDGAPLLAIAANRYFREPDGLSLDAGPFVAALEYAAGVQATLFGKPAPAFFQAVLADLGVAAGEALMIGDDVEADVNGALASGIPAVLVRSGKYRPGDEARIAPGGACAADLVAALDQAASSVAR